MNCKFLVWCSVRPPPGNNLRMDVNCKSYSDETGVAQKCNNLRMDVNCKAIKTPPYIIIICNNLRMDVNCKVNVRI